MSVTKLDIPEEYDAFAVAKVTCDEVEKVKSFMTKDLAYELVMKSLDEQIERLQSTSQPTLNLSLSMPMNW